MKISAVGFSRITRNVFATLFAFGIAGAMTLGSGTPAEAHYGGVEYLWGPNDTYPDDRIHETSDTADVILAMEFKAEVAGSVSGVRICLDLSPSEVNGRLPVYGYLWDAEGNLLASGGAYEGITTASPCFYEVTFSATSIQAWTPYIIGFGLPGGQYSYVDYGFDTSYSNATTGHLIAPAAEYSVYGNGLYAYTSSFGSPPVPTDSWHNSNYLVGPKFTPASH